MFDAVESIVMQVTADEEKRVAVASLSASYKAGRRASVNMELAQAYDASQHDELVRKAAAEFREMYHGTGAVLGEIRITKSVELPVDWSYGEGEDAKIIKSE